MTIEDQIKDEKLQYDINIEATKISALSSGKIDKYEYLTGEEILPSNQQQIIEQAKFTYSPLGKAFEKQTKTIKKQIKAIQDNNQLVNINKDYDYKDKLLLSKEREIFKDIYNKRLDKIEELNNEIDYNDLNYVILNKNMEYNFSIEKDPISLLNDIKKGEISVEKAKNRQKDIYNKRLDKIEELNNEIDYNDLNYVILNKNMEYNFSIEKDPISLLNDIKKGEISVEKAKNRQKNYLNYLNIIRKGNKNAKQKKALANINMLYNARNDAIKFIEDCSSMIIEAKKLVREQEGTGLKILTPNQMLKRLPIALAQVKAGNNSESLLNEIRQIVYSLYRSKEITKKVYNNIINLIKV